MSNLPILRDVAPHWDYYDWAFAGIIFGVSLAGYATFVHQPLWPGVKNAWPAFVQNSGLIVLLTGWTAIIGIYRLRHRPDKNRPSVREDFNNLDGDGDPDFGLRNFGPGPALYVQAVATLEREEEEGVIEELTSHQVHETPIHLREGEFLSLVQSGDENEKEDEDWLIEMTKEHEICMDGHSCGSEDPLYVNLYYTYVSQSGAREPTNITSKRDDAELLGKVKNPGSGARSIELQRVAEYCLTES